MKLITTLFLCSISFISCHREQFENTITRTVFFDVGQGDAALIVLPDSTTILVDAGSGDTSLAPLIANQGVKKIDHLILTHPQRDHYGGAREVIKKIQVHHVGIIPTFFVPSNAFHYRALLQWVVDSLNIDTLQLSAGRSFHPHIHILSPQLEPVDWHGEDSLNGRSIVFSLDFGSGALFTGDLNLAGERVLLQRERLHSIALLKVGHHGSASSTSRALLNQLQPQIGIISVGEKNDYGHPATSLLERLEEAETKILRTDRCGSITIWLEERGGVAFSSERCD